MGGKNLKFSELGLDPELLQSVERLGFEEATPIQEQTIPLALEGKDVIGQAQTGTGKTAAFGLPMLQKIDLKNRAVQGLVIAPTRELAIQTQEELFRLSRDKKVRVQVVYGGADISRQIRSLKDQPHIVVGTPGRLLDHINRRTLKLDQVETLVLDEADEMLNMGFLEDIEKIIKEVPKTRQTLLFSATMPDAIKRIGVKFMNEPEHVRIQATAMSDSLIDQYYVRCKDFEKFDIMTRLLDVQTPELTIVFGRTKRRVDELSKGLEMRGYRAEGIHGDLSQQKRMSVLKSFKKGDLDILVATDVAARGLDISGVTHVYNYDIPQDPESYVHRIGRTGRAGKEGMSVTFITPNEMGYLRVIEDLTKKKMTTLRPPTNAEAFEGQVKAAMETAEELVKSNDLERYEKAAAQLLEDYDTTDIAAAFLKSISKDASEIPVKITPERPLPSRKGGSGGGGGNRGGASRGKGGYRGGSGGGERRGGAQRGGKDNRRSGGGAGSGGSWNKDAKRGSNAGGSSSSEARKGGRGNSSDNRRSGGGDRNFTIRNKEN
ncbi:ATP-dependent helicase [Carnobacterium maltaromaticum]|nr:ATP-dependent RNA helicase [Carnobacterium maltaromaticum DSM 20342]KRN85807.1 ATP-dependent RNA helicase [Carnobacterium maltaromaticum]MBC9787883.1 DEAD/DEAH box helicase [Carnobacterium maltaromaticum]TFJ30855.1 ATP-dependent helicase [Carnobacterium maltaromaticum]TFJ34046.1 ATP-dependent helicase [Carnobacterium maltaromaticum]